MRQLSYIMFAFTMRAMKLGLHPVIDRKAGQGSVNQTAGVMPRWVKIFCAVGLALIAIIAGSHLAGGGIGHLAHSETDTQTPSHENSRHQQ